MKIPILLATCILVMPFLPLSAETADEAFAAAEEAAQKAYAEKYNELIESGKLEPKADELPGKPDSLERRLWLAGYYTAVVELADPAKAKTFKGFGTCEGSLLPGGPKGYHSKGYIAGQHATCEMAHELYLKIWSQHIGEMDARFASEQTKKKATGPAPEGEKKAPR